MIKKITYDSVRKLRFLISTRVLKIALFLAILLCIVSLLKDVNFKQTLPILANLDVFLVIVVLLIGGANILMVALRWYVFLKVIKSDISFKNVVIATIGATAVNTYGPGKLGVPAKAMLIKKLEGLGVNHSTPSILMELFFEVFTLTMFLIVSALAIGMHNTILKFAADTFTYTNILHIGGLLFFVAFIAYLLHRKLAANQFVQKFVLALKRTLVRKDVFATGICISVANLTLHFWADQLLFKALHQDIPYGFIVFSSAFSAMAGMFSPLPSGVGVWELSRAYLFKTYYGIGELAVVMTLMRRLLTYLALGVIYMVNALLLARDKSLALHELASDKILQNSVAGD